MKNNTFETNVNKDKSECFTDNSNKVLHLFITWFLEFKKRTTQS